jgi:hypothetical protein
MRCPRRKVGLPEQFSLFADRLSGPEGLRYAEEFVSPAAEKTLIGHIAVLPLQPFKFGQYEGKRRVASFGFRYDYTMRRLEEADPIPEWLGSIIEGPSREVWEQHPSRRGAALLDHLSDDGREILMARP